MAVARTPRQRWIEEGLRLLAEGGPDAVRIEPLAQRLGVTKGGFYGYFAGRQALLEEMLDTWESGVSDEIIEEVEATGGDARDRLRRLFAVVSSRDDLTTQLTTDLAVRHWAQRDSEVADRLRRVDRRRLDYLAKLLGDLHDDPDEVRARAWLTFTGWIGEHFMVLDRADDPAMIDRISEILIGPDRQR